MSLNANNTTSGDNSSDSASNKNNFKSQIEIVDQKLKKCRNEIEKLNKELESKIIYWLFFVCCVIKKKIDNLIMNFFFINRSLVSPNE